MSEWQPIETAPRDGTPIRALMETTLVYEEDVPSLLMGGWKRAKERDRIIGWMPVHEPLRREMTKGSTEPESTKDRSAG
jgi:hypothetical protein